MFSVPPQPAKYASTPNAAIHSGSVRTSPPAPGQHPVDAAPRDWLASSRHHLLHLSLRLLLDLSLLHLELDKVVVGTCTYMHNSRQGLKGRQAYAKQPFMLEQTPARQCWQQTPAQQCWQRWNVLLTGMRPNRSSLLL